MISIILRLDNMISGVLWEELFVVGAIAGQQNSTGIDARNQSNLGV